MLISAQTDRFLALASPKEDSEHQPRAYPSSEDFGIVLSFYGVELQSHAGLIIASSVGILTLLQVWGPLRPLTYLELAGFSMVLASLVSVAFYCIVRLVTYGILSSMVMFPSKQFFDQIMKDSKEEASNEWIGLGRVSHYASRACYDRLKCRWFGWLVTQNLRPNLLPVFIVWLVTLLASLSTLLQ